MEPAIASSRFRRYVRELRLLNAGAAETGGVPFAHVELAHGHLNGRAARELRSAVALTDLRRIGAFFTGDVLADQVVERAGSLSIGSPLVDPACGCGDLLLAAARRLPLGDDLESTLGRWGEVLHGVDRIPEFVEVTRQRLMLLALLRGARVARGKAPRLEELLPKISVGDGRRHQYVPAAGSVVLNPPYGRVATPPEIDWTSGLVTDAALWTASIVEQASIHARVVAVLPDVLRSGSRYGRWRAAIAAQALIDEVQSIGQFDALTDVDVFVLSARRSTNQPGREWPVWERAGATLADLCSIMVGPVVDRRDEHKGPCVPYVTTNVLPQTGEVIPDHRRRFAKRLFQPPFVVVRRTSRPTVQEARLRPVIIRGSEPVAVENHLLVLKPARPTLRACRMLVAILADQRTTDWLNRRIRTRHLTVSALAEVPLSAEASRFRST